MPGPQPKPLSVRIWGKFKITDDCWEWTANRTRNGYGTIRAEGTRTMVMAHRAVYEVLVGPIPEGLTLDHLCRNKACVNPDHLEPVTYAENNGRGWSPSARNGRKTHCIRGHELAGDNLMMLKNGRGCRECHNMRQRAYHQRKREA